MEILKLRIVKITLKRENKVGELILPNFKTYSSKPFQYVLEGI
jgi:hypothetical protein